MTRRINLRSQADSGGRRYLDDQLDEDGDLLIEGYDSGPAVEQFFSRDTYEWTRTVRRAHLADLAVALGGARDDDILDVLEARAVGEGSYELERLLREEAVPSELWVD